MAFSEHSCFHSSPHDINLRLDWPLETKKGFVQIPIRFALCISLGGMNGEEERKRPSGSQTDFNVAIKQRISATISQEHKMLHTDGITFHSARLQASLRLISV